MFQVTKYASQVYPSAHSFRKTGFSCLTRYSKNYTRPHLLHRLFGESTKSSSIFSNITYPDLHDFHPDVGLIVFDMDLDSKLHTSNLSFDLFTNDGQTKTRLPDLPDLSPSADYFSACMVIVNRTTVFYAGENQRWVKITLFDLYLQDFLIDLDLFWDLDRHC